MKKGKLTDIQFNKLLRKLGLANETYKNLLFQAEEEIKERYGVYPSAIDLDSWIDAYHVGTGEMSAQEVDEIIKNCLSYEDKQS